MAVVVDPIQSVKGKVVIDAFRWAAEMRVLPAVHLVACSLTLHVKDALMSLIGGHCCLEMGPELSCLQLELSL